jgi:hypothetical protein
MRGSQCAAAPCSETFMAGHRHVVLVVLHFVLRRHAQRRRRALRADRNVLAAPVPVVLEDDT